MAGQVSSLGTVLCVLTGASRGFGKSLAWELCSRVMPGSMLLLVSRTEEAMRGLAEELTLKHPGIGVRWVAADLGTADGLKKTVQAAQEVPGQDTVQKILIINNAGSLGDISKSFVDITDPAEVDSYFSLNVSSALCLTSSLLKTYQRRPGLQRLVINISSLAAVKPFKSWSLYCAGKAARVMMFRVLAEEETDLRVLNYGPGPLDTDMQAQVRAQTADPDLRLQFINMKNSGQLIDSRVSARKLLDVIQADAYQSGANVDFYE
ncbi:sepiapterin reductase [Hyperolius riggenbachi]|uniref:sepiapterin reductase n=1 Tax=Hyperolius riggenbachi TaxID=752182 RepID=UPI0035A334A7